MNALLGDSAYALAEVVPIELRILHGAQAGSRLCLAVGEYTLGCDDSCTLILDGSGVEERHAILRFDGETAWIDPVDGIVRNAHGDEIDDEQELTYGMPVELGNVWISVDREDAPWPDPSSVMPIDTRKNIEKAESDILPVFDDGDAVGTMHTDANPDGAPLPMPKQKRRLAYALLGALMLVAGGLGAYRFFQTNLVSPVIDAVPTAAAEVVQPPPQAVVELIKDFPRTRLTLQREPEPEHWVVTGYVAKPEQQHELSTTLASVAPTVQSKVLVEEELAQSARQVLAGEPGAAFVKVNDAVGGILQLAGAGSSAEEIQRLQEKLLANVPGVSDVKSQILLPPQLAKVIRERIAAANLGNRLAISSDTPEMQLSGKLTMEEIRRWEDLLVAFNREYGNVLAIRATVTRLVPKPPVGVQAIVGGAVPYIVTPTGEHINQGGDVNGHTLVSVKDGEVVFEGRQRVRIGR